MAPVAPREVPVGSDDHEVHDGGPWVPGEHRHHTFHVVGRREEHVVVERDDEIALRRRHACVSPRGAAIGGQLHEADVGEIAPDHLGAAVGGGVVDGDDLEGAALPARHLQRAAQYLTPLIVEDRDRDGAQFGTWRLIIGPTTLAIGTGTRFHASMKWP